MKYGKLPMVLDVRDIVCDEFMFYQYLPIKLATEARVAVEKRLACFEGVIGTACCDYVGLRGLDAFIASYVYVTAKHMYQAPGCPMNRPGWHSDGFLTDDINYIWSDCAPTVFNHSNFDLTPDDELSLLEMERQALPENNVTYADGALLRLDQFSIHRVADVMTPMLRTFLKISFSTDKYDLIGNAHNDLLAYQWSMRPRGLVRNIPQSPLT